jgi:hypothetical protein
MVAKVQAASTSSITALPLSIIQPVDVGHLLRELKEVNEKINQDSIRSQAHVAS